MSFLMKFTLTQCLGGRGGYNISRDLFPSDKTSTSHFLNYIKLVHFSNLFQMVKASITCCDAISPCNLLEE